MIKFVEINPETILNDVLNTVENEIGETLHDGDERKMFIKSLMPILVALNNNINDTANQNFLENARDGKLDAIAIDYHETERLKATYSRCRGMAELSKIQTEDILIPKGSKVTSDGIRIFEVEEDTIINAGKNNTELILKAVSTGEKYNGIAEGKINHIIEPIAFVSKIYNIEVSKQGSDIEDDKAYRERARLEMESKSVAGPEGAYEYWAYSADNSITGIKVTSPEPGTVKIYVAVDNGEIPSQDILDKVYDECSPKNRRPLTDKVEIAAPEVYEYDIALTYYLDSNYLVNEGKWRKAIEGENLDCENGAIRDFINWQQNEIGKEINVEELKYDILNSVSYKDSDGRILSGVRKLIIDSPGYNENPVAENQIAKPKNITVKYGGTI